MGSTFSEQLDRQRRPYMRNLLKVVESQTHFGPTSSRQDVGSSLVCSFTDVEFGVEGNGIS